MNVPFILYFWCFLLGLLGLIIHVVVKLVKEDERARTANMTFNWKAILIADKWAIVLNFLFLIAFVVLLDLAIGYNPSFIRTIKYWYIPLGYNISSIGITILGQSSKIILKVIDAKTNIADEKNN